MKRIAIAALAAACNGTYHAPPAVPSIAMPSGDALKPYDSSKPGLARPEGMALVGSTAYVTLGNYGSPTDPNDYAVHGPGLLAAVIPSTGATTVIDLGGSDGQQCKEPGFVRQGGSLLYVACTGDYNDGTGQALIEVDPASNTVKRSVALAIHAYGVAITSTRIWVGDSFGGDLYAVDKSSFAVVAGPVAFPCPAKPDPLPKDWYETTNDVISVGDDLYALCSNSYGGALSQLDGATGAVKLQATVGPISTELAETGDGRIAIVSSGDNLLRLVTPGSGALTVATGLTFNSDTQALQDVRARDHFVFTVASLSNTVQKIDLDAKGGPAVVAEASVGAGANPWNILPLDDFQALVSNQQTNALVSVKWAQ